MSPQVLAAVAGALAVVASGIGGFVGAVLGSGITALVQSTVARKNRRQQLRMAALDRRLQAHQEAYHLWQRLYWASSSSDDEQIMSVATESEQWWEQNCLYLEP
jgi:hypothetical protein